MDIHHVNEDKRGYFEATDDGVSAGKLTYEWKDSKTFIVVGTEVAIPFKGRGIGKRLVMVAVEYARANNLKIIPKCPFVVALFDRLVVIGDVLSEDTISQDEKDGQTCSI